MPSWPRGLASRVPRRRAARHDSRKRSRATIADGSGRPRWPCSRSRRGCGARARRRWTSRFRVHPGRRLVSLDATTAAVAPRLVDRAVLRARVLAAAESAAIGASVAAWSAVTGLVVALVFALWRSRFASKRAVVEALERANPASQNLFVTADEIDRGLVTARPAIRARVMADAARAADSIRPAAALPARRLGALVVLAVLAWATVAAGIARRTRPVDVPSTRGAASAGVNATQPGVLHVAVTIEPPSYTGLATTTV